MQPIDNSAWAPSDNDLMVAANTRSEVARLIHLDSTTLSTWRHRTLDVSRVLMMLVHLPPSVNVVDFFRGGFCMNPGRSKFLSSMADGLVERGQMAAIEQIVADNKFGLTVDDLCCKQRVMTVKPWPGAFEYESLADVSVKHSSADALRLAFKLSPGGGVRPSSAVSAGASISSSLSDLHLVTLNRAIMVFGMNDAVQRSSRYIECVKVFIENGVRAVVDGPDEPVNRLARTLMTDRWVPQLAHEFLSLLRQYHASGQLDINTPIEAGSSDIGGLSPLAAAIRKGNSLAAKEFISLGCDCEATLESAKSARSTRGPRQKVESGPGTESGASAGAGGKQGDLLDLVRSLDLGVDTENEMIACVTSALMERAISAARVREERAAAANLVAVPLAADPARAAADVNTPRRTRRAAL